MKHNKGSTLVCHDYLTNNIYRKTYASIKRSIDDWLRLKNFNKIIKSRHDKQDSNSQRSLKDIVNLQELYQYKAQFKPFTTT